MVVSTLSVAVGGKGAVEAVGWLHDAGDRYGIPLTEVHRLDVCLDETLANLMMHGGLTDGTSTVELQLWVELASSGCEARVRVADRGRPFDPLSADLKPLPQSLDEAVPGGLGLRLMRSNSDSLRYERSGECNVIEFGVRWGIPVHH